MSVRTTWYSILGAAALVLVGCGQQADFTGPSAPTEVVSTTASPSLFGNLLDLRRTIKRVTQVVRQLPCLIPDTVAVNIGPAGGTITLGNNSLVIPAGSLTSTRLVVMLPLLDGHAGVQLLPHGLVFNRRHAPTLTLDTRCIGNPAGAYIVYTDDFGTVLETLTSTSTTSGSVSAKLRHFSRYAVAW